MSCPLEGHASAWPRPTTPPDPTTSAVPTATHPSSSAISASSCSKPRPTTPPDSTTSAVRVLLALEIDARALLPADTVSHGFDNVIQGDLPPALLIPHTFPRDGEYDIRIHLMRDRDEKIEGLEGNTVHQLEILLDGEVAAAIAHFEEVLCIDPAHAQARSSLNEALAARQRQQQ